MSDGIERLRNMFDESSIGKVVLRGTCPFCGDRVTFKQINCMIQNRINGHMVPILCEGCTSIVIYSNNEEKMYPSQMIKGVEGLPKEIDKYYKEALRCVSAYSPNGAVTLFRKTIHAIGIHYSIANKNDDKNLFEIIKKLEDEGHITKKIKDALLGIKDIGNDGAHINENEPDMSQALILKELIDMTLNSTILSDESLRIINEKHKVNKSSSKSTKQV